MRDNAKIFEIFPSLIYAQHIPEEIHSELLPIFNREKMKEDREGEEYYGKRSVDTYLLNKPEYDGLSYFLLKHCSLFAEKYLGYNYKNYKFSQSWISIKYPGQFHTPHTHPHSLISGVLFYGDNQSNTPSIHFRRMDEYAESLSHHKIKDFQDFYPKSKPIFELNHNPGGFILFPSSMVHGVRVNESNSPRKSLAFNLIPRDGFGDTDLLTELKF